MISRRTALRGRPQPGAARRVGRPLGNVAGKSGCGRRPTAVRPQRQRQPRARWIGVQVSRRTPAERTTGPGCGQHGRPSNLHRVRDGRCTGHPGRDLAGHREQTAASRARRAGISSTRGSAQRSSRRARCRRDASWQTRTSQPCSSNKLSPPTRASRRRMRAWRVPSAHSPRPTRPRKNCHQIRACGLLPCARSLSIRFWPTPIQPWEVYARDHDWTNARASFTKAIELEPTLTTAHTDFVLTVLLPLGHAAEALHVLDDALRADPLSLDVRRVTALVQIDAEQYDAAIANARWVLQRDPAFPLARLSLARALVLSRRFTEGAPLREGALVLQQRCAPSPGVVTKRKHSSQPIRMIPRDKCSRSAGSTTPIAHLRRWNAQSRCTGGERPHGCTARKSRSCAAILAWRRSRNAWAC